MEAGHLAGGGTHKLSDAWYRPPNPSATNDLEDELELGVVIAHHSCGAMIEWASHDSRIVPGDVMGSGTVTGGTVSEAICNGLPAP
jgi:2-keto-4-pentenoate hydratase/2-oxohepta-3-ene-1,7-dioic acid hydratase in catechol pathway